MSKFKYAKRVLNAAPFSIPAFERIMQLYAFGHTMDQIAEIINQEFSDIDYNNYTPSLINSIINENSEECEKFKMNVGIKCRNEVQDQVARLFSIVKDEEESMVEVFAGKMQQALQSLRELDLNELDEDGNYKNTSRIFVLTEMVIKLQSSVSKIVGTDALREIEVFRAKARAKQEEENSRSNGLLPAQRSSDSTVEIGNETNWH